MGGGTEGNGCLPLADDAVRREPVSGPKFPPLKWAVIATFAKVAKENSDQCN